ADPQILLADEPTGNLDSVTGDAVLDLLLDLNRRRGLTIVMVTHNEYATRRADRTIELADGRIRRDATTAEQPPASTARDVGYDSPTAPVAHRWGRCRREEIWSVGYGR